MLNFDNIPRAGDGDDEFGWLPKESGDRFAFEIANTSLEDLDVEENKEFPDVNERICKESKELEKSGIPSSKLTTIYISSHHF